MRLTDFRRYAAYQRKRVSDTGKSVGRDSYWRLFAAENTLRILLNSVLLVEVGPDWWTQTVAPPMQARASRIAAANAAPSRFLRAGPHGLYFLFLPDLAEVMRANAHLLFRLIPDVDGWVERIEGVRRSRNAVAHMNRPTSPQRTRIARFYRDVLALEAQVSASGINLRVP